MPKTHSAPLFYTVSEVADRLDVKESTVRTWLRQRTMTGIKIGNGKAWRIPRTEIERMTGTMPLITLPAGEWAHLEISESDSGPCVRNIHDRSIWWFGTVGECENYLERLRAGEVKVQAGYVAAESSP